MSHRLFRWSPAAWGSLLSCGALRAPLSIRLFPGARLGGLAVRRRMPSCPTLLTAVCNTVVLALCAAAMLLTAANGWGQQMQSRPAQNHPAQPANGPARPPAISQKSARVPRTPDGHPDLQGIWTNTTLTPMERPRDLAGKEFFTKEEAAAYEKRILHGRAEEPDVAADTIADKNVWWEQGTKLSPTLRTSMVVDPPDGRVPALTPEAQKRQQAERTRTRLHALDGPEYQNLQSRCLLMPMAGPPMIPGPYNNNYEIVQTPNYVAILIEMIHDVRIVPLDGRPHLPSNVPQWLGDPRGHWEGDTLVVDTTNFTDKTAFRGSDWNLHLIERFTRVDPDTLIYRFTIDNPTAFTKPWTAEIPMLKASGPIYEFACHEGNYGMINILRTARAEEKAAEEAGKKEAK